MTDQDEDMDEIVRGGMIAPNRVLYAPVGAPYKLSDIIDENFDPIPPWQDLVVLPPAGGVS